MVLQAEMISVFSYPVHVKSEENLVDIAVGLLCHPIHLQHGLQLKERDESWRWLPHEFGVPVVHIFLQDIIQAGAVGAHSSSTGMISSRISQSAGLVKVWMKEDRVRTDH